VIRGFIRRVLSGSEGQVEEPLLPMEFKNLESVCYDANEHRAVVGYAGGGHQILYNVHRVILESSGHSLTVKVEPHVICTVRILNRRPRECAMEAVYRNIPGSGDLKELYVTHRC
jgi:hypothetical protein